jgi:hypothetical protein
MYVRDSKRQGLRVRYVDDTFFYPFTSLLDCHLIISSIVVPLGCAPRGRCIFYIFMARTFPPAFPFPFSTVTFLTFSSLLTAEEGGCRDLHYKLILLPFLAVANGTITITSFSLYAFVTKIDNRSIWLF